MAPSLTPNSQMIGFGLIWMVKVGLQIVSKLKQQAYKTAKQKMDKLGAKLHSGNVSYIQPNIYVYMF